MGDRNQELLIKKLVPSFEGPILEIGSKDYGSTYSIRKENPDVEYMGVDLEAGPNVDMVLDIETQSEYLDQEYFGLILCCSVMEHTKRPWVMAEKIQNLLKPGGQLFLSVPWVWRYHMYPDDYWRFSPTSLPLLFPDLNWSDVLYSTNIPGEHVPFVPGSSETDNSVRITVEAQKDIPRRYMPYLMVNAVGTKPRT